MIDPLPIADHAAQQSDRWLFMALLVVIGGAAVAVWRWLVGDRKAIAERLESVTDRHIKAMENMSTVIANNNLVITRVVEVMRGCPYCLPNQPNPHARTRQTPQNED